VFFNHKPLSLALPDCVMGRKRGRDMKTKIFFKTIKAEFFDTGHEIDDLSIFVGAKILAVDDLGGEGIILLVEHPSPYKKLRQTKKDSHKHSHRSLGKAPLLPYRQN